MSSPSLSQRISTVPLMLEESFYAEMTDLSSVRDICPKVLSEKTIPIKIILHF